MSTEHLMHIVCEEMPRLERLSKAELTHEVIEAGLSNNPLVTELLNRADPGWLDRYDDEGNPLPSSGLPPFASPARPEQGEPHA